MADILGLLPTLALSYFIARCFMSALLTHWNNKASRKKTSLSVGYLMLFDCLFLIILVSGCS